MHTTRGGRARYHRLSGSPVRVIRSPTGSKRMISTSRTNRQSPHTTPGMVDALLLLIYVYPEDLQRNPSCHWRWMMILPPTIVPSPLPYLCRQLQYQWSPVDAGVRPIGKDSTPASSRPKWTSHNSKGPMTRSEQLPISHSSSIKQLIRPFRCEYQERQQHHGGTTV